MSEMLTPFSDSRHTKAGGKFTPQICRSRIFVPANECARVVPMYPCQSAMSHLHSLAQSVYVATFLPKHVITTCFADYVTSTSGAIRLAFDLLPLASSFFPTCQVRVVRFYHSCSSSASASSSSSFLLLPCFLPRQSALPILSGQLRIVVCTPGPQPQGSPRSVHPWTSTARIRSQCAPLHLNRKDPIAVCIPGPQPQGSDRSVHPWTSTARIRSQCASLDLNPKAPIAVCTPGPHPQGSDRSVHPWTSTARIRSQCAPLDLNRRDPIAVCTAGPQPDSLPDKIHKHTITNTRPQTRNHKHTTTNTITNSQSQTQSQTHNYKHNYKDTITNT